jgi:CHAT domain-containing protein/tetratricopeptide (TPR) repeat protein
MAQSTSCTQALGAPAASAATVKTLGTQPANVSLALTPGDTYLIEVAERDNDALVEVLGSKGELLAESDHPERRTGTRRAVVVAPGTGFLTVRVTGKEHANAAGMATVRAFTLARLQARPDCLAIMKALAAADADYAVGQAISHGRIASPAGSARAAFLRAADGYSSAARALLASHNAQLLGEAQLALAGVDYFDLQDWTKTADWAETAARTLATIDPYRDARAQALLAAAWLEIGSSTPRGRRVPGYGVLSSQLLARARAELQRLTAFHLRRGERYDAGLQLTNIGLTYLYESRFPECVTASEASSRLFGSIREAMRRAQAWGNAALCLWGLGRLADAQYWLERSLKDIRPEPHPRIYLASVTNTALLDYALGHFDDSLRLYDGALTLAQKIQSQRDAAYCLYGIGVNYYALGDRMRARGFLERALAIRTVAVDGRGRMATLRALANIDAEDGRMEEAITADRAALALTVAHSSLERIRIQLAVHIAAAGHLEDAKAQLDDVLTKAVGADPLLAAEALLQRAIILREMGRPREALTDLKVALPRLHRFGSLTEEFAANLERGRDLRIIGEPHAALEAVERALRLSDAVRLQSANPELRSDLQAPLRAAYDLKIELLRARYDDALNSGRQEEANTLAVLAFRTADASRARSFADLAAERYPPVARRELAPELHRREALYHELAAHRFALEPLLDHSGSNDPRARHLIEEIAELERRVDMVNTVIATRAALDGGPAQASSVRRRLAFVPADTALVSYWLGYESAYVWVVSPAEIQWVQLISPAAIADEAKAFHGSLTRLVDVPIERRLENAHALYESIVAPVERSLSNVRQWVIIPDGALDYVPFAALRGSGAKSDPYVIARHDIALTPAAWMLDTSGHRGGPAPSRALLLVADPVYQPDDPRLASLRSKGRSIQTPDGDGAELIQHDYQRLPFTAHEAASIAAEFPSDEVDELTGLDATRARLLSIDWSKYRFIHIATHGVVDARVPDLSALMLGSYDAKGDLVDGAVRVADLSLRTLRADLAVFSACDTALGKDVPSEGLVGIGSTVLARGAGAVVASLWPVSDEMGAHLMTDLYRHLVHDAMSAPAALGTAMRSVLSRDGSADPALWAAYQVSVVALGPGLPGDSDGTAKVARTTGP